MGLEPAHVILRQLASKELSPREVVAAAEEAYRARNGEPNAIVTPTFDAAKQAAIEAERRVLRGEMRPLEGLPLAVKDSVPTAGVRTTYGSPRLERALARGGGAVAILGAYRGIFRTLSTAAVAGDAVAGIPEGAGLSAHGRWSGDD